MFNLGPFLGLGLFDLADRTAKRAVLLEMPVAAATRLNSAENVRRCLLIRHLSSGEDFRLNQCPGSVDHYTACMACNQRRHQRKQAPTPERYIALVQSRVQKGGWHGFRPGTV